MSLIPTDHVPYPIVENHPVIPKARGHWQLQKSLHVTAISAIIKNELQKIYTVIGYNKA